jgi:hypothetical protein
MNDGIDEPLYYSPNPLPLGDPAYWMLEKGLRDESWRTPTHPEIYKETCYICIDPEFALMGLPVCKPCPVLIDGVPCGAHWAADDSECDNGCDVAGHYLDNRSNDE